MAQWVRAQAWKPKFNPWSHTHVEVEGEICLHKVSSDLHMCIGTATLHTNK